MSGIADVRGPAIGDGDQGLGRERGTHLLEADHAGGEPGAGIGKYVTAVKGVRFVRTGAPVGALVDLAQSLDAVALGDQRQKAVVRTDEIVSSARFEHHREALGTHAGIHDGDEYGVLRPELLGLIEPIGTLEYARIFMAQIRNQQILRYAVRDALHGGNRAVRRAEIGEQHQRRMRVRPPG